METTVGNQRFNANGTISPYGITRIYAIDIASSISNTVIALYNGLTSTSNLILQINTLSDGTAHESWTDGILFSNGVYLNTFTNANIVTLVSYSSVKA